jgi:hypothetical protein
MYTFLFLFLKDKLKLSLKNAVVFVAHKVILY